MLQLLLMTAFALNAQAELNCKALQFEIINNTIKNEIEKPLVIETKQGSTVRMAVDIGERYYSIVGDIGSGDFLLTQAYGKEYTSGINATGTFTSTGRLQISMVENTKVFKLICTK